MPAALLPQNEPERLKRLADYGILDTVSEAEYDDIVRLAAQICQTPIALISLIDESRQWFKAKVGLDVNETHRDAAFCAHAILKPEVILQVQDALVDERFEDNVLVQEEPGIRFYAGAPLVSPDGFPLGTLCVIDVKPRKLSQEQTELLAALSRQVAALLQLRIETKRTAFYQYELERSNEELKTFANIVAHDLKEPLRGIEIFTQFLLEDIDKGFDETNLKRIRSIALASHRGQKLIDRLHHLSKLGYVFLKQANLNLNDLVKEASEAFKTQLRDPEVSLQCADLPAVEGDPVLLTEVFSQLISNALKYHDGQQKQIRIGSALSTDFGLDQRINAFYVADNGIGINAMHHSAVFEIFRRLHADDAYGGGSGTGLPIVQKIVRMHGGSVWIDRQYKDGTCCWFTLEPIPEGRGVEVISL
jgi:signal transduction histidine kinase